MQMLSGCSGKSVPLKNHFLLNVSGCPPTTFKAKGCAVINNSILYCICLLKNMCIVTWSFSYLWHFLFSIFPHNTASAQTAARHHTFSTAPLTRTSAVVLVVLWRRGWFLPLTTQQRAGKHSSLHTPQSEATAQRIKQGAEQQAFKCNTISLLHIMLCSFFLLSLGALSCE